MCVPDTLAENAFVEVLKDVGCYLRRNRSHEARPLRYDPSGHQREPQLPQASCKSAISCTICFGFILRRCVQHLPDPSVVLNATAWSEVAVKMALAPTLYDASRIGPANDASKVEPKKKSFLEVRGRGETAFRCEFGSSILDLWVIFLQDPESLVCYFGAENCVMGRWLRVLGVCKFFSLSFCFLERLSC